MEDKRQISRIIEQCVLQVEKPFLDQPFTAGEHIFFLFCATCNIDLGNVRAGPQAVLCWVCVSISCA